MQYKLLYCICESNLICTISGSVDDYPVVVKASFIIKACIMLHVLPDNTVLALSSKHRKTCLTLFQHSTGHAVQIQGLWLERTQKFEN